MASKNFFKIRRSAVITVEVVAFNSFQAQKAIEAMYGSNLKSWFMHPYQVK